ncbi:MAG: phosphoglucosamine mutase [Bacteroidales bacterium]|nr:phosphoglucosamine mutase [Bacteroidales bacterium]MDE6440350.1 phosphoglucosamine mutase [Bacteroidales bacterium]
MTLIKSVSGIRGTVGGRTGDNLTPLDAVKFTTAYAAFLKQRFPGRRLKVVVGRDARISGPMVQSLVNGTLMGMGVDVVDLGLTTTPTIELSVTEHQACGGIMLTASHNPVMWNALKLLNAEGEFLNAEEGAEVVRRSENLDETVYAAVEDLGGMERDAASIEKHIAKVVALKDVDVPAIKAAGFKLVVDPVNSTGSLAIPALLKALGVEQVEVINGEADGRFAHNPEPLAAHLTGLSEAVRSHKADAGIAVDPDVDRLAFMCEDGVLYGEEYTLVTVADYILSLRSGAAVSNLSSSRALRDVAEQYGGRYAASAVGEVHVVAKMKAEQAVIGGEGNGGVIYPPLHYGRDALVGVALFLTHWAHLRAAQGGRLSLSELKKRYPDYTIAKHKMELTPGADIPALLAGLERQFQGASEAVEICKEDGLKISFPARKEWVHLRKSNTEPIIRIYAESATEEKALALAEDMIERIKNQNI